MAEDGSEIAPEAMTGDDQLIIALAGGLSVKAAAKLAGMAERTAYRRRADPDFRRRLAEARAELLDRAIGHLSAAAADAAITLRRLLRRKDAPPAVQAKAAEAILDRLGLGNGPCPRCRQRGDAEADAEDSQQAGRMQQEELERTLRTLTSDELGLLEIVAERFRQSNGELVQSVIP